MTTISTATLFMQLPSTRCTACLCNSVPGAMEANTKMWVRQRPADPWRDALQKEQEEASTYAELLASAATAGTAAAAGPQGPTGMGVMGQAGTGQLPGGIAVQLPGLGGAGGGIPGIGVPGECGAPCCHHSTTHAPTHECASVGERLR